MERSLEDSLKKLCGCTDDLPEGLLEMAKHLTASHTALGVESSPQEVASIAHLVYSLHTCADGYLSVARSEYVGTPTRSV